MSASPEPQAGVRAATPDHDEHEKVATPIAGDDDGGEKSADHASGAENNVETGENEQNDAVDDVEVSDDESILSEVDEAQFENFDPDNVDVEERAPLHADAENLKLIGRHKRKRAEGEEGRSRRKEGRREKKSRRDRDDEGEEGGSSRRRERKKKAASPDTDEETLDPETRMFHLLAWNPMEALTTNTYNLTGRRRALDRAMDEAMKKPTKRRFRKQDGIVSDPFLVSRLMAQPNHDNRTSRPWPTLRSRICGNE